MLTARRRLLLSPPAPAPPPPFDPSTIAGLQGWWKADALALSNGASVATWTDSSANGNDLAQATGANKPTFLTGQLNGLPAVQFDGTDDELARGYTIGGTGISVFTVCKLTAAGSYPMVFTYYSSGIGGFELRYSGSSGQPEFLGPGSGDVTASVSFTNAWLLAEGILDLSGGIALWANRTQYTASASGGFAGAATLHMGKRQDGNYFQGLIAELLYYNAPVGGTDRTNLENYLGTKWGL